MKKYIKICLYGAFFCFFINNLAFARDYIRIVGSSTVYPFISLASEQFIKNSNFPSPIVEANGTGGGFAQFCQGIGFNAPDINNASRPITKEELALCAKNGITDVMEVKIGFDGIAVIYPHSIKKSLHLSTKELFLAISKMVPSKEDTSKWVPNFYKKWSDINSKLPNVDIAIMGPPTTSGTRDIITELLDKQCKILAKNKLSKKEIKQYCGRIRYDGPWEDGSENYALVLQKVANSKNLFALMGYNYYSSNSSKINSAIIDNVSINKENIASDKYALSRPLYIYVKVAHLQAVPGLQDFIKFVTSKQILGQKGILSKHGLVPLSDKMYNQMKANVNNALNQ